MSKGSPVSRQSLIPVAAILVVVIVAISPRALLAPSLSFNQAQESKRPKTPKNIVRANPCHTPNSERPGKSLRPDPATDTLRDTHDLQARPLPASSVPDKAFHELTKPEYLKLFSGSPPGNPLAPPA
ncbi:MAG TPA: hypothetical protein VKW04_05735 [Planctomycetota bacterium]|nr:hypothetical protein [Planctomycetota bacterium]